MNETPLDASIILPTFEEAENLPHIIPAIDETLRSAGLQAEILVVDDDSPDDTAAVAERLARSYPVRVMKRTGERGLATAVIAGFGMAQGTVVVVMDADGSHPVSALPQMIRAVLDDKTDFAVGSRHVAGGGMGDWPLFSQLKSKLAALVTVGLTTLTDPTSGFMAARRSLVASLPLDPVGWKIVLETIVKAHPARVMEVPIVFADRRRGESKQNLRVAAQYARHLTKLYRYRYPALGELVKFCLVGLLGLFVDLAVVVALKEGLHLDTRLCAVGGFGAAVSSNYLINRLWTFADAPATRWLRSYLSYVAANLVGLTVRVAVIHALITLFALDRGHQYIFTNLLGIAAATLVNFVGAKFVAFAPERRPAHAPPAAAAEPLTAARPPAWVVAVVGLSALYFLIDGVVFATPHTGDEHANLAMARNMLQGPELLVRPSYHPGGHENWLRDDFPDIGNTPLYSALAAAGLAVMGVSGAALWSFVAWLVTLGCSHLLVRRYDARAGVLLLLLMAASPGLLQLFRHIEMEPILTGFCAAGLLVAVKAVHDARPPLALLAGALFGLGFVTKLWLIVPFVFALLGFVVVRAFDRGGDRVSLRAFVALVAAGFATTACAHLVLVAATSPQDLAPWVESVYLGIFSGEGVTGAKLSGVARYTDRGSPAWYYPLTIYRDHCALFPLILLGLPELLRRPDPRARELHAMIAGAALSLVVLSVPAFKERLYALPALPLLYAWAAHSVSALWTSPRIHRIQNRTFGRFVATASLSWGALVLAWSLLLPNGPPVIYALAHALAMSLPLLLMWHWERDRDPTPTLSLAATLTLLGLVMTHL